MAYSKKADARDAATIAYMVGRIGAGAAVSAADIARALTEAGYPTPAASIVRGLSS